MKPAVLPRPPLLEDHRGEVGVGAEGGPHRASVVHAEHGREGLGEPRGVHLADGAGEILDGVVILAAGDLSGSLAMVKVLIALGLRLKQHTGRAV